jgi:uncharacterized protein YndB with AHSA1/START domain
VIRRRFASAPEEVFDAWLDPALARRWLFVTPASELVDVEIGPRVGGRFRFLERGPRGEIDHFGRYLEIDRPRRLAFALEVPATYPGEGRVEVDVAPAAGGCELALAVAPAATERFWPPMLDALGGVLGEG